VQYPQQTAASHRARELYPDGAARLMPAIRARRFYSAHKFLTRLVSTEPAPGPGQLRELAAILLDAAADREATEAGG
jgi:hypothetical protein